MTGPQRETHTDQYRPLQCSALDIAFFECLLCHALVCGSAQPAHTQWHQVDVQILPERPLPLEFNLALLSVGFIDGEPCGLYEYAGVVYGASDRVGHVELRPAAPGPGCPECARFRALGVPTTCSRCDTRPPTVEPLWLRNGQPVACSCGPGGSVNPGCQAHGPASVRP